MPVEGARIIVNPSDLTDARVVPISFPDIGLAPGRCLFRIDRFAMTANNVTYGRASHQLGYWEFFPHDEMYGQIPVWGFADVVASSTPEVAMGTRVYGFLPMSTHLEIVPGRVTGHGFTDEAGPRQGKAPIYNNYAITSADPMYRPEHEGLICLFRPLYTTSFLLDDFFRSNAFFGAEAVVLTSASSKTALGMAHAARAAGTDGVQIVGLTSSTNAGFVRELGIYDSVITYDALETIRARTLAYVDMAGNGEIRRALHTRYGDDLKHACLVGGTHWTSRDMVVGGLPGPKPEFFFAPSYAQQRVTDWGAAAFQARLGAAWTGFVTDAGRWIDVHVSAGADEALRIFLATVAGEIPPNVGNVLSLNAGR